jgi:hypothetical protein
VRLRTSYESHRASGSSLEKTIGGKGDPESLGMAMVEAMGVLEAAAYMSFILAAVFAVWQLRMMTKDRRTQIVVDVFTRSSDPRFVDAVMRILDSEFKDAKEAEEKCYRDNLIMVGHYFEGLGLLLARKLVDRDLILEVWPYDAVWEKMKPWTIDLREKYGNESFEWFEYLASQETDYMRQRKGRGLDPSAA